MNKSESKVLDHIRGTIAKTENSKGENETTIGMDSQFKQSITNCMVYIWNVVNYVTD